MDSGKRDNHKTHKPIKTYLFRKTLIKMQYRMAGTAERGRYRNSSGSPVHRQQNSDFPENKRKEHYYGKRRNDRRTQKERRHQLSDSFRST